MKRVDRLEKHRRMKCFIDFKNRYGLYQRWIPANGDNWQYRQIDFSFNARIPFKALRNGFIV